MPLLSRKLKKGSRAAYRLLGAGPHGWRGLPPNVLKKGHRLRLTSICLCTRSCFTNYQTYGQVRI